MKTIARNVSIMCAMLFAGVCAFGEPAAPQAAQTKKPKLPQVQIRANLTDGSLVYGAPLFPFIVMDTGFGRQFIPLNLVTDVGFAKDDVKVKFANNDVLTGKHVRDSFAFKTVFGDVRIPRDKVRKMTIAKQFTPAERAAYMRGGAEAAAAEAKKIAAEKAATPPKREPGLLLHATLNSANENLDIFNAKMEAKNVKIVDGRNGKAMFLDTTDAKMKIKLTFSPYTMQEGTVEFWAKIPNPYEQLIGRGQPLFFNFSRPTSPSRDSFIFGITYNDGSGKGGLVGRMPGVPTAGSHPFGSFSNIASTKLLGDTPDDWHHYAFVWKRDGFAFPEARGSSLVLMIDGKIVAKNERLPANLQPTFESEPGVDLILNDDFPGSSRPVMMSDFKIWNRAKMPSLNK